MGAAKDLWMDEIERVGDDFAFDRMTRQEAVSRLCRLGFDHGEAEIMLDEAVA